MKKYLLIVILLISKGLSAQFSENFSDSELSNSPTWLGDASVWQFTAGQLQSNGPAVSGTQLQLSTASSVMNDTQWEFFANLKFGTSSNNYLDVFLSSSASDLLAATTNGYYIRIGGTTDEVSLFKKSGTSSTKIIDGTDAFISGSSNNPTKVKITRNATGVWNVLADITGTGANYVSQGTITDNTYTTSAYFGFITNYTSSNSTKFYIDNITVGNILVDNTAPTITSISAPANNQITVLFSEPIAAVAATTLGNYTLNNGLGNPITATINPNNANEVLLTFASTFTPATTYTVTINNIEDFNNNTILPNSSSSFTYTQSSGFDVLINEIMADPDPSVQLPPYEYIELYNRSSSTVNLANWSLTAGNSTKTLPAYNLLANSYLIITKDEAISLFNSIGITNVIGLGTFFGLGNAGGQLVLTDNNGAVIHQIAYTDDWYFHNAKKDGGWSIEQIDPNNPCGEISNWQASNSPTGGTPGTINSINASKPDTKNPIAVRAYPISNDTIAIYFSETILTTALQNTSAYSINNGIGTPISATPVAPNYKIVKLAINTPLQPSTIYEIMIATTITDCAGNAIPSSTIVKVALPDNATNQDLVINELLTNPKSYCYDFIEFYNTSDKVIDLKSLYIGTKDTLLNLYVGLETITNEGYLVFPKEYVAITENFQNIISTYPNSIAKNILQIPNLPTYDDKTGVVALVDITSTAIDVVPYSEDMHFGLLSILDGISLERINPTRKSNDKTNWNSAASTVGYATPGYQNSQYAATNSSTTAFTVFPDVFSPDNDGTDDNINMQYQLDNGSYLLAIQILDSDGRLVKKLVKNELVTQKGAFGWDGLTDANDKAKVGIYIAYFEAVKLDGTITKAKKVFVLAGR